MLVGIDEVGRGCLAGPLVAGAVILPGPIKGLKDSKQLTKLQRQRLSLKIYAHALAIGIGWVDVPTIDSAGITASVRLAMERALAQITIPFDQIIIDGNSNYFPNDARAVAIVKADKTIPAVSAASVVAKVARDAFMRSIASQYPEYAFEKHVGYGTSLHLQMLSLYGVSDIHRRSFRPIQSLLGIAE